MQNSEVELVHLGRSTLEGYDPRAGQSSLEQRVAAGQGLKRRRKSRPVTGQSTRSASTLHQGGESFFSINLT